MSFLPRVRSSFILITPALFSVQALSAVVDCVPARETVAYSEISQYHRIHPSGNFILYTNPQNKVDIVDITNRSSPRKIPTKMINESYPVEGSDGGWDLIASPRDWSKGAAGGMDYYRFAEMISGSGTAANPTYTDPEHGGWYHSSAELSGSTKEVKKVRTLIFEKMEYRDYEMKMEGDKVVEVKTSPVRALCGNILKKMSDQPQDEIQKKKAEKLAIEREKKALESQPASAQRAKKAEEISSRLSKVNVALTTMESLRQIANPILSKDGAFVAGLVGEKVVVYKIKPNGDCDENPIVLPFRGAKVSFSYPEKGKLPSITFTTEAAASAFYTRQVHVFDLNTEKDQVISIDEEKAAYYAGFTQDGRVIYKTETGFSIVDPNQVGGSKDKCIKIQGSRGTQMNDRSAQGTF